MMKTLFIDVDNGACLAEVSIDRKFSQNEFVRIGDGVYTVYAITHGKEKIVAHVTARFEPPACDVIIDLGRLWTREPPTKPGVYWARKEVEERGVHLVRVVFAGGGVFSHVDGRPTLGDDEHRWSFDLWCGPIEAPPLPEGT